MASYFSASAYFDDGDTEAAKRRRLERACDFCRRRKTKCDGPAMRDGVCTNCMQNRKTCSYMEASKPRGPPKAYVNALEDRMERMESLLLRLRPEANLAAELGPPVVRDSWKDRRSPSPSPTSQPGHNSRLGSRRASSEAKSLSPAPSQPPDTAASGSDEDDDEDDASEGAGELTITPAIRRLTVVDGGVSPTASAVANSQLRFHGKSSSFKLLNAARRLKSKHLSKTKGADDASTPASASSSAATPPATTASGDSKSASQDEPMSPTSSASASLASASATRKVYWTTPSWELAWEGELTAPSLLPFLRARFPPDALARTLIDLFFEHVNTQFPLLHRPTFARQWAQELHTRDVWFATVCTAMFAVASRWCEDERVLPQEVRRPAGAAAGRTTQGGAADGVVKVEEEEEDKAKERERLKWQRAGWDYFEVAVGVHQARRSIMNPAGLFEVQTLALLALYVLDTEYQAASTLYISAGLRLAQDVGAHRRRIYSRNASTEGELWKRVFWVLVLLDRMTSAHLGRTCCLREEEFDLDMPAEVDDEYWENDDGALMFKQPEGKPAVVSSFCMWIKLTTITAFALRTVCASDKSKNMLGIAGRQRKANVVAELNSALIDWAKAVPDHLHWDPLMPNNIFAKQSAMLYIAYHLLQLLIYRPFVPPACTWAGAACHAEHPHPHEGFPFPASALCVNAARSIARILDGVGARADVPAMSAFVVGAHVGAAVLIMHVWELKSRARALRAEDVKPPPPPVQPMVDALLRDVAVCAGVLERAEPRWINAGHMLQQLKSSLPGPDDADGPVPRIAVSESSPEEHAMRMSPEPSALHVRTSPPPSRSPSSDGRESNEEWFAQAAKAPPTRSPWHPPGPASSSHSAAPRYPTAPQRAPSWDGHEGYGPPSSAMNAPAPAPAYDAPVLSRHPVPPTRRATAGDAPVPRSARDSFPPAPRSAGRAAHLGPVLMPISTAGARARSGHSPAGVGVGRSPQSATGNPYALPTQAPGPSAGAYEGRTLPPPAPLPLGHTHAHAHSQTVAPISKLRRTSIEAASARSGVPGGPFAFPAPSAHGSGSRIQQTYRMDTGASAHGSGSSSSRTQQPYRMDTGASAHYPPPASAGAYNPRQAAAGPPYDAPAYPSAHSHRRRDGYAQGYAPTPATAALAAAVSFDPGTDVNMDVDYGPPPSSQQQQQGASAAEREYWARVTAGYQAASEDEWLRYLAGAEPGTGGRGGHGRGPGHGSAGGRPW